MNVLNTTVSIFPNYYTSTNPKQVNLETFLKSKKYRKEVEAIRATEDKAERDRLKANLPAITPSGIFTERKEAGLVQHSGLIQLDIDWKENSHISNFFELKEQLCKLPQIAYLALSVSGKGFWGLVPLAYPDRHKEHFKALRQDFAKWGLALDEKPGNVASLRGYSWDRKAYFNPQAEPYRKLARDTGKPSYPKRTRERGKTRAASPGPGGWDEQQKVEACLEQVEAGRIDIAPNYADWFALASSLASHFGEAGRDYFHRASQFYPCYQQQGTDRQFSACLKSRGQGYTIATFYRLCQEAGITYQQALKEAPSPLHGATRASSKPMEAQAIPEHKSEAEQPTRDTGPEHAHTGTPRTRDTGHGKHGPGLPEGFQATGAGLEVDGLPWNWLNEEEQEAARERLAGKELEALKALNPNVSELVARFGLVEE